MNSDEIFGGRSASVTFPRNLKSNGIKRKVILLWCLASAFAVDPEWLGFRGPSANPPPPNPIFPTLGRKLPTSNRLRRDRPWLAFSDGRGQTSFVTTVMTDGEAKQPQVGTDYSNDYVAELSRQGIRGKELMDRLNALDSGNVPDDAGPDGGSLIETVVKVTAADLLPITVVLNRTARSAEASRALASRISRGCRR
jgi:hypothetical protein